MAHISSQAEKLPRAFQSTSCSGTQWHRAYFGVVKRRWAICIFTRAPEYPMETQAMLVPAIAALHNFLRIHEGDDDAHDLAPTSQNLLRREGSDRLEDFIQDEPREISPEELGMLISAEEKARASARRDRIAQQMWKDYVALLAERGGTPNT